MPQDRSTPEAVPAVPPVVTDDVQFDVPGIGSFSAQRLTARRTLAMYRMRDLIAREEIGYKGALQDAPSDVVYTCDVLATLQVVNVRPVNLEKPGIWDTPMTSPDDVVAEVYTAYMKARMLVPREDEANKESIKNSSSGSAN